MEGVPVKTVVTASAEQLRALLAALQRAPVSPLEAMAIEAIFNGWFQEIHDQLEQARALEHIADLAARQSPNGIEAAGDVLSAPAPEGPPETTSAARNGGAVESIPE